MTHEIKTVIGGIILVVLELEESPGGLVGALCCYAQADVLSCVLGPDCPKNIHVMEI